ncbi:hypothetical protein ZWY2020_028589 [Hordeum vulgare]|nr:hypothetical protein ZWY2020_028589 [Hordeum vulgare]
MSDKQGNATPGGYFIGRPTNTDETKDKETPQAVPELAPAVNNLPGANHEHMATPSRNFRSCPCM